MASSSPSAMHGDIENPEHREVVDRHLPARMIPHADVLQEPDELMYRVAL
jgi:hypothetical protein